MRPKRYRPERVTYDWSMLLPDFSYSPREFYALVDAKLEEWEIPGLVLGRIDLHESSSLSAKREYLNLERERLAFYVCAAPFGTGFFVSSRLVDERDVAGFWHYLASCFLLFWFTMICWLLLPNLDWAIAAVTLLLVLLWSLMRLAVVPGWERLDWFLARVPILGPIYQTWFNPDTYYRQDVAIMYRTAVHESVVKAVDGIREAKGVRPMTPEERKPRLKSVGLK